MVSPCDRLAVAARNLAGSIQLIQAVLPHLCQPGAGRIVQVSSEGGQTACPRFSEIKGDASVRMLSVQRQIGRLRMGHGLRVIQ